MKIDRVTVRYGELRSVGFNNTRYEVELTALLDSGETPNEVKDTLFRHARVAVRRELGEKVLNEDQMDIPF